MGGIAQPHSGSRLEVQVLFDPAGVPNPHDVVVPIDGNWRMPVHSVAIEELVRLGARLNAEGGFAFAGANRGSGRVVLRGFDAGELERITDWFRVEAEWVRLGLPVSARPALDMHGRRSSEAVHNPILFIVFGSAIIVFAVIMAVLSSVGPMKAPGEEFTWVYLPLWAILAALGVLAIVLSARRLPAWFAMRASFRARGEQLPLMLRADE